MGRITVHLYGKTKDRAMATMFGTYAQRLEQRSIRCIMHPNKLDPLDYVEALLQLKGEVILMDEGGVLEDSVLFSKRVERWMLSTGDIHLAIGPAEGWPNDNKIASLARISLSPMTFPHELASVILVEQLYRSTEIINGTLYHRV